VKRLQRKLRSCYSLIDCCDRLIVVEILHRMVKKVGCAGGVTKRDGVVKFLRTCNWMVSKLHALGMMWNFIVVFHGRYLIPHVEPRQLLPSGWNVDVRSAVSYHLKEVIKGSDTAVRHIQYVGLILDRCFLCEMDLNLN
jgi:hypothetical protein